MNRRREAGGVRNSRSWWRPWTWLRRAGPPVFAKSPQQLEMILGGVKPMRNGMVDDDVAVVARGGGRLLHETRASGPGVEAALRAESNRMYERLRGRRTEAMRVRAD